MKNDSKNIAPRITPLDKVIGAYVRRKREEQGLHQDELADRLQQIIGGKTTISTTLISFLERGERSWNTTTISAVLNYFNVTLADIVGGVILSPEDKRDLDFIRAHREAASKANDLGKKLKPTPAKKN